MFYPQNRFRFAIDKRRRIRVIIKLLVFLLLVGMGGTGIFFTTRWILRNLPVSKDEEHKALLELWKQNQYDAIISTTEAKLQKNPMDSFYLTFHGFAQFYKGVNIPEADQKIQCMNKAVISLRRANLHSSVPMAAEINYVLGKAYFHKGVAYYDLSAKYLEEALQKGFFQNDTYEYLGLAYLNLSDLEQALKYFHLALERNPSDILLLTLGQTYDQQGQKEKAEEYLLRCVNMAQDSAVEQKARFLLGDLYFQRKEYLKAEEHFQKVLALNPQDAEANFLLGEVYLAFGDSIKARSYWRRAVRINPKHYGALKRLYG
ncbi:MAG: tetratricopeptide repeat protein [Spirochaetales bacterium]